MESERLTWKQIQEKYPDQWIGVTDIVFEDENAKTDIASAVVKYIDKDKDELTILMAHGDNIRAEYTTPNKVFALGMRGMYL